MNNIFSKFNVYDQIGYLLVGSVGLIVAHADFYYMLKIRLPEFNFTNLLVWVIVSYFLGHLIQAIANVFIKEKKEDFDEKDKEILNKAKSYFKLDLDKVSDGEVWSLCYMLASAKDITGQIQNFNAYYSLYRGWFIVFSLESVFISICMLVLFSYLKLVLLLVSIGISLLFYTRLNRFYKYLRSKVLQTFVVITTIEKITQD